MARPPAPAPLEPYIPTSATANLTALARAAGVSKSTVSRALNGRSMTAKVTRDRIIALAEKMGFRPNPYMRTLMSQVRGGRAVPYQATLAWVDCHPDPNSWRGEPVNQALFKGVTERAHELGYTVDRFFTAAPRMTAGRLTDMLLARGIYGAMIVNLPHYTQGGMPPPLRLADVATVMIGSHTALQGLNFTINDTNSTARKAFQHLRQCGYKRIGMLTSRHVEQCVDYGFVGGYVSVLGELGEVFPAPILYRPLHEELTGIATWIKRNKLDAILVTYRPQVEVELIAEGVRIPHDIGLATTDWAAHPPHISGMDQQHGAVAAAAVDLLDVQLQHGLMGLQPRPHGAIFESIWHDGTSTRPRDPQVIAWSVDEGLKPGVAPAARSKARRK